jgi:hypothetical protein
MPEPPLETDPLHQLKNHLSIIVGFADLMLAELKEGDPRRADVHEIVKSARAAMAIVPRLTSRADAL